MNVEERKEYRLNKAKNQVKKIRAFYIHLAIFMVVMLVIAVFYLQGYKVCLICFETEKNTANFIGFLPWLFFLTLQGLVAFKKLSFISRWEERKMKEFMEE